MITIIMPENKTFFDINKEITECRNIKDKENRNSTLRGLNKIKVWA